MKRLAVMKWKTGSRGGSPTPVHAILGASLHGATDLALVDEKGQGIPAQFTFSDEGLNVHWIGLHSGKSQILRFFLVKGEMADALQDPLLAEATHEQITVSRGTDLIMCCNYSSKSSRPFVFPLNGPTGLPLTWNEPPDHVHHKSLWVAHGDVNQNDIWSELPNHGIITTRGTPRVVAGPVFSEITMYLTWSSFLSEKLLEERRTIRLWNAPDRQWLLDHESFFSAPYRDVLFGDTKEAGAICVRVRESMEVENGGRIENSWGGINEVKTWGKKANWCDYSGPVDGTWQGIAILDAPENPRHPTYWHVRDYGLMTANVFGATIFNGEPHERGGLLMRRDEKLEFKYRICVHNGDSHVAEIAQRYSDYASPPKISASLI